ncbi:MAG: geranylgeranylglyceryl/heptaprenylglyceryl phosphate synthase [Flavobacteriaceae bacterium]|nr:geranylgeranylglyceryl/heptaprenylglyceryl phosphate synthase [Flavobacteriaceae bacterium]
MKSIYEDILKASAKGKKLLAVLIDPDKMERSYVRSFVRLISSSIATHIFVGGSEVDDQKTQALVAQIKTLIDLPVVLFPGEVSQITNDADALLFLSLISGRNPEYLIGKHIEAAAKLNGSNLEVIPTGYILIENGKETSVQRVSKTMPMSRANIPLISYTAKAGELLGMKLIYLEAGSGATHPVNHEIIMEVKDKLQIPLIVGGGIKSKAALKKTFDSGADLVVIGTAFENDSSFFNELKIPI